MVSKNKTAAAESTATVASNPFEGSALGGSVSEFNKAAVEKAGVPVALKLSEAIANRASLLVRKQQEIDELTDLSAQLVAAYDSGDVTAVASVEKGLNKLGVAAFRKAKRTSGSRY